VSARIHSHPRPDNAICCPCTNYFYLRGYGRRQLSRVRARVAGKMKVRGRNVIVTYGRPSSISVTTSQKGDYQLHHESDVASR
jgi:hypothetical protein